jgi:DNA invertase Pin-like site-specific DNA recombinase
MNNSNPPPSAFIQSRDTAARRCVSLMFASAIAEFTSHAVSEKQMAEVEAASDEWETAGALPVWQD